MLIRITGMFIAIEGKLARSGVNSEKMANDTAKSLRNKGFDAVRTKDILEEPYVETDISNLKRICKTMLKGGAYKITIEYIG